MTSAEADQFIISARKILRAWQWEIDRAHGEAKAEAMAARDSVLGTLMEMAEEFPSKREKIDAIAKGYRYGVWAGWRAWLLPWSEVALNIRPTVFQNVLPATWGGLASGPTFPHIIIAEVDPQWVPAPTSSGGPGSCGISCQAGVTMKALVDQLSVELSDRYVQYLETFMIDLWSEAGFIEFRCGFTLRRDHELRTFTLKMPAAIGETDAKRKMMIAIMFEEIEGLVDTAIAEHKLVSN
ncbi:MAG TPA: hypothetical protein VL147_20970 [Devosia sp.]|nr:hypothetical protein [Devosia sp.]